ncbi:CHAT domain-containing protein [Nakamurella sp.]|uniref:CHAT domain-containing protein n=1 Tax=Nakamurella sp. TaxID=1869182 RepID=UPI003B3B0C99
MERLVEYYLTSRRLNVFVVTPGDPSPHALCLTYEYEDLAKRVAAFRRAIWREEPVGEFAGALGAVLLEPLRTLRLIEDEDVLCIAPHRCLHGLPFAALGSQGEHALLRNPIAHLPSGAVLPAVLRSTSDPTGRAIVVVHNSDKDAEELRASFQREAASIAAILDADIIDASDGDTLAALSTRLPGARAVHFVCHAHYGGRGRSGLVLRDEKGADRLASMEELSALRLDGTLVSFGGCETGRAEPHQSDDRRGIVRAALTAGASSVLATLWPIHSHMAEIVFAAFFEAWEAGYSRAESLRRAQRHLMEQSENDLDLSGSALPTHWAPYILVGSWR